ncbi:hypothetical protein QJQ45_011134 [Haematococcus lacustris]|nr:hypothetical protein QJQ45_011134 [Haematococcus lacustris]
MAAGSSTRDCTSAGQYDAQLRAFLGLNGHIPVESFHWLLASSIAESAVLEPICDAYAQCLQDWGDLPDREEAITELLRLVQEHLIDPPSYQPGLDPAIVLGSDKHSNASVFTLAYRHAALQAVTRGTFSYSAAIDHLFTHCLQVPSLQQGQRDGLKRDAVRMAMQSDTQLHTMNEFGLGSFESYTPLHAIHLRAKFHSSTATPQWCSGRGGLGGVG